eukprot:414372_1
MAYLRWYILTIYSCVAMQFLAIWFIFGSITSQAEEYYNLKIPSNDDVNQQIALLLSLGPFLLVLLSPIAVYILRYPVIGLQLAIRISSTASLIGIFFTCIPSILSSNFIQSQSIINITYKINGTFSNTLIFLYLGAIINCASASFILSSAVKLSVMWFYKTERNMITGIASVIGNLGQSISFFLPPLIVANSNDLPKYLYGQLIIACIICIVTWMFLPPHPKTFPSLASQVSTMSTFKFIFPENNMENDDEVKSKLSTLLSKDIDIDGDKRSVNHIHSILYDYSNHNKHDSLLDKQQNTQNNAFKDVLVVMGNDFKYLFKNKSSLLLVISGGINFGITNGWIAIIQDIISPIGLTQKSIGFIGGFLMMTNAFGALFVGAIVDKFYRSELKKCILFLQFLHIIYFLLAFILLPNCLFDGRNDTNIIIVINGYNETFIVVLMVCFLIGSNFGCLIPLYFELLAEVSYPVAETSSSNLLMCLSVPAMLGIMQIGTVDVSYCTPIALMFTMIIFVIDLFVVEKYNRPNSIVA